MCVCVFGMRVFISRLKLRRLDHVGVICCSQEPLTIILNTSHTCGSELDQSNEYLHNYKQQFVYDFTSCPKMEFELCK